MKEPMVKKCFFFLSFKASAAFGFFAHYRLSPLAHFTTHHPIRHSPILSPPLHESSCVTSHHHLILHSIFHPGFSPFPSP